MEIIYLYSAVATVVFLFLVLNVRTSVAFLFFYSVVWLPILAIWMARNQPWKR